MNSIITSAFGSINWRDVLHGLYVAVLGAVLSPLIQWADALQTGKVLSLDYKQIGYTALAAGVGYLIKRFFTPATEITPAPPKS